ncbi:DEAD/DEAH box helicase [Orrella sp. 11846]|uniref:DEAD/DEAH box helicase n=1 Tax=Orrella sp. 11846 TaxID=3409913 RepID=UPI003B5BE83F
MNSTNISDSQPVSETPLTFEQMGLHPAILKAVVQTGYTTPTPIQAQALPVAMVGADVMGAAQTGTGKTAAFTLPVLHRLMALANASASPARHPVRAVILTPTRELADQVYESVCRYSQETPLRSTVIFGGVDIGPQKEALRNGCEILVATPGRLLDHMNQKTVNLSQVGILVLDEADRMLDMGFLPDLERIVQALPKKRQTMLFSATFSNDIRKLGRTYLSNPVELEVATRNATADTVTQIVYEVRDEDKRDAVAHLVKSKGLNQVIVFSNTKLGAARLARQLERDGVKAESIHGDKSQQDRMRVLEAFKAGELEVLVATDVAARGIDVAGVPCVINYDLPFNAEDYVHRIGRTGRAGASGEAISLFNQDNKRLLQDIEKLTKQTIPQGKLDLPRVSASRGRSDRLASKRVQPPVDDFFLKPYEPSVTTKTVAQTSPKESDRNADTKRVNVGVLLGGSR